MFLAVLLAGLLPRSGLAAPAAEALKTRPVIVPGRELEVMALLQPYELGDELAPGWTLHSVSIDVGTITVRVVGRAQARLTLDHHGYGPPGARKLACFALKVVQEPPGSEVAMERLVAAIERNDDGSFWADDVVYAGEPREHPFESKWVGAGALETAEAWARDGIVFLAALTLTLLVLVRHELRGAPPWMRWALLGIVVLAVALRVALSPSVALAPWPYTRLLVPTKMIFHGPGLAALHPEPVWLSETILGSSLVFSCLAPLAVYAHARYLLDDHRAGLLAALVIAILPLHLRFSYSDTAFIPSITVSSAVFALVHAATRERSRLAGWVAIAVVGVPLALVYEVRPLNIIYFPLLLATALVHQGLHTDKPETDRARVVAVFVVMSVVTFGLAVPRLLGHFGAQVDEGMSFSTLGSGLLVLVSPRLNELLNPVFSPPGLVVLAIVGAVDLWRRGRRRLFWFIVSWLLGLLVAHAYVVPKSMYMQARYHLHLVVPYTLLVVCGADAGLRWLAQGRERGWAWLRGRRYALVCLGALGTVLASPLVHLHGIRHVELDDVHEWRFVHGLRGEIPAQCTVAEHTGQAAGSRLARVGSWVEDGVPRERWRVVEVGSPDDVRALVTDPPECLYWYEGLPCFGHKAIDEPKAPACLAMEEAFELEEVAAIRFESEPYDESLAKGLGDAEHVELRLYRARTKH